MRKQLIGLLLAMLMFSPVALAAGGGGGGPTFAWKDAPNLLAAGDAFVEAIASGNYEKAYKMGGEKLRSVRTLEEFTEALAPEIPKTDP